MDFTALSLIFAQAQPAASPSGSFYSLALRRWCSSLTLSSPQAVPSVHGLWALLAGLSGLLFLAIISQGPYVALRQFFDLSGHLRLVHRAARGVWRVGRVVVIMIGFTVLSWTTSQGWVYAQETRRLDLVMLTKSRSLGELAIEQGILAALTPLRDVAGLADNLPLLVLGAIVVFRMSFDLPGWGAPRPDYSAVFPQKRSHSGWATLGWGCASLYALYRIVARMAGSTDLPLGNCLVIEALLIPILMVISDGILLAWLLTEIRNSGLEESGDSEFSAREVITLMPGAALACAVILPARYLATFVWLAWGYMPTSAAASSVAEYFRWQLGWGLTDIQAAAIVGLGMAGGVAWSRGTIRGAIAGYGRLLSAAGGYLAAVAVMASLATAAGAAAAYAVVLLLPVQSWVLAAADSYAHFATLPVGLWTLAAVIELAKRSLPTASLAQLDKQARQDDVAPLAAQSHPFENQPPVATAMNQT